MYCPDGDAWRARRAAGNDAGITGVKGEVPQTERGGYAGHSVTLLAVYSFIWGPNPSALVLDISGRFPLVDSQAWGRVQGSEIV